MSMIEELFIEHIAKNNLVDYLEDRSNVYFEIRLCIIKKLNLDWESGWAVFTKYFSQLENAPVDRRMLQRIYKSRKQIHGFSTKNCWEKSAAEYRRIRSDNRLYCLEEDGTIALNRECKYCKEREKYYFAFLDNIPTEYKEPVKEREINKIQYSKDKDIKLMDIKNKINGKIDENYQLPGYCEKKEYELKENKDWKAILDEMGEKNPERYRNRDEINLKILKNNILKSSKVTHIVGSLGSGKSTFKEALIYDAIKTKGMKITAIEEGIPKVLDLVMAMKKCGINAVPYIGNSSEYRYYEKYFKKNQSINEIIKSQEVEFLSGICMVKACAADEDLIDYPCNKLKNEKDEKIVCPYTGECGHLSKYRQLKEAELIVTTPQAAIKSSVVKAVDPFGRSLYELLFDISDMIIVDEADCIQRIFDEELMTTYKVNRGEKCILKQFGGLLSSHPDANSSDNRIYSFNQNYHRIQEYVGLMERVLRKNKKIITRYQGKGLIPTLLRDDVLRGCEFALENDKNRFEEALREYVAISDTFTVKRDYLKGDLKLEFDILRDIHLISEETPENEISKIVDDILKRYKINYKKSTPKNIEEQKQKLILLLLIVQFDAMFKKLCDEYSKVYLKLTGDYKLIEGYARLNNKLLQFVTEAPLGTIFEYKLLFDEEKLDIEIDRYEGVGRKLLLDWSNAKEGLGLKGPALLCLSGTSLAPKSAHYNIDKELDAVLIGKTEGKITMDFLPVIKDKKYIHVSGCSSTKYRSENLKSLVDGIENEINYCLSLPDHRKVMIVCGNYREAEEVCCKLKNNGFKAAYVCEDDRIEDSMPYSVSKKDIENIPTICENPDVLVVSLKVISRGYNILDDQKNSYFGTMFFMTRPYMIPGDYKNYIQMLHYKLDDYIKDAVYKKTKFNDRVNEFRKRCFAEFREICNMTTWKSLTSEQRDIMTWFILILMKQAIGRMQRNGNDCFVYLCDGAFCDAYGNEEEYTSVNSTIHAMENLLSGIINDEATEILYGNFYEAIKNMNMNEKFSKNTEG